MTDLRAKSMPRHAPFGTPASGGRITALANPPMFRPLLFPQGVWRRIGVG